LSSLFAEFARASLPTNQRDQVKLLIGFAAVALAVLYWMYPYAAKNEQLTLDETHVAELEDANQKAAREFSSGSIEELRSQAAQNRSALTVMRRLVPTGNEVPALLEEVSTAARRAGLDVGGVTPEAVIPGQRFDTYRYTVTIIGGYHQFGEFLANVGSLPRIVAPVNFNITAGSSNMQRGQIRTSEKGALAATITLQTYVEKTTPPRTTKERSS
jgi:type IV pilus assembly protein PilO